MSCQRKYKILKKVTYSPFLKNKIAKKCVPRKLIICHGRACKRSFVRRDEYTLFLDHSQRIEPDIRANIHWVHKKKPKYLKSQFRYMTSIYAPICLFFNKPLNYLTFNSIKVSKNIHGIGRKLEFHDQDGNFLVSKFLNSKVHFHQDFMKSLLYMLEVGGKFEFTDNFIFAHYKSENTISDDDAIKIFQKMLGNKSQYFNINIETKSKCINYQKKAKECRWNKDKFMVLTKVKEFF